MVIGRSVSDPSPGARQGIHDLEVNHLNLGDVPKTFCAHRRDWLDEYLVAEVRKNERRPVAKVTGWLTTQSTIRPPGPYTKIQQQPTSRLNGMHPDVMVTKE